MLIHIEKLPPLLEDVQALRDAIKALHGVDSRWVEWVDIHRKRGEWTVVRASVHIFDLVDHPQAKRAYVWREQDQRLPEARLHVMRDRGPW